MMYNMHELGSRVREARRNAGLTQPELAKKSGVGEATIARLEGYSANKNPRINTLIRIADATGVTLKDLLPNDTHIHEDA